MGDLLRDEGATDAAERSYRAALRSNPRLAPAHLALGMLLWSQGDTRAARTHLEQAQALGAKLPAPAQQLLGPPTTES